MYKGDFYPSLTSDLYPGTEHIAGSIPLRKGWENERFLVPENESGWFRPYEARMYQYTEDAEG